MIPSEHMFYGFFDSLLVLFLFPSLGTFGFLIVFLSSFLIDTDHYLAYVYLKRDFSLSRSVEFYLAMGHEHKTLRTKKTEPLMIFHTAEFWLLLVILSFFNLFFFYILIGVLIHVLLDLYSSKQLDILHVRPYSVIRHFLRKN